MANAGNIIPNSERTPEERKRIARNGGIASGAKRRKIRDMKEAMRVLLESDVPGKDQTGTERVALAWFTKAGNGDIKAIQMILDMLYGKELKVDHTSSDGTMVPPSEFVIKVVKANAEKDS